jgi:hypothetical protein
VTVRGKLEFHLRTQICTEYPVITDKPVRKNNCWQIPGYAFLGTVTVESHINLDNTKSKTRMKQVGSVCCLIHVGL